jgi:hypothetical protein
VPPIRTLQRIALVLLVVLALAQVVVAALH